MTCTSCGNHLESFNRFCPKCGAPVPPAQPEPSMYSGPSQYNAPYNPPQIGAMGPGGPGVPPPKKSGCGKVILILAIILLVLGGAIAAAVYFGYQSLEKTLKSSEAYTIAFNKLKENEEVREELGEIKSTGFPLGAFTTNADGSGNAAFVMSVQGEKGDAQYEAALIRSSGVWRLEKGMVRTKSGKMIDVTDKKIDIEDANFNTNINNNTFPPLPKPTGKMISGGVLNGKATSLPKPVYPPIAKAAKASGTVTVQVVVDESGQVVTARAISGHPLLRGSAQAAARQAKFSPTILSGKPVKVSGVITYNFVAEE